MNNETTFRSLENPRGLTTNINTGTPHSETCPHQRTQNQEQHLGEVELEQPAHRIQVLPGGEIISHPYLGMLKELAEKESKLKLESHELELEPPKFRVFVDKKTGEVYRRD